MAVLAALFLLACTRCSVIGTAPIYRGAPKTGDAMNWIAPPPEIWANATIPKALKTYMESEWIKSRYEKSCSDDMLKIVPVYFWPGERVDLPCAMCELAFVLNGKVKRWAVADDIADFLTNPRRYVVADKSRYRFVQNAYELEDSRRDQDFETYDFLPNSAGKGRKTGTNEHREPPAFQQRDGKLMILRAAPSIQGVYFCFDDQSIGVVNLFYVVMALTPPLLISSPTDKTNMADGCAKENQIFPTYNWKFYFVPRIRRSATENAHEKCAASTVAAADSPSQSPDTTPSCSTSEHPSYCLVNNVKIMADESVCDLDHCRTEIGAEHNLNAAIELRWDPWSSCTGGIQRREGHCYLVRRNGYRFPETGRSEFEWIEYLNSIFDVQPFKSEGIMLYSSLIASAMVGETKLENCQRSSESEKYEYSIRNHILSPMGVPDEGKARTPFLLKNAFEACMTYHKVDDDTEYVVGTYAVETRKC